MVTGSRPAGALSALALSALVLLGGLPALLCGTAPAWAEQTRASFRVSMTVANTCAIAATPLAAGLAISSRCAYPQPATQQAAAIDPPGQITTGQAQNVSYVAIDY